MKLKHLLWVCAMEGMRESAKWKNSVKMRGIKKVSEKRKQNKQTNKQKSFLWYSAATNSSLCHNNIQFKVFLNMFPRIFYFWKITKSEILEFLLTFSWLTLVMSYSYLCLNICCILKNLIICSGVKNEFWHDTKTGGSRLTNIQCNVLFFVRNIWRLRKHL